MNLQKDKREIVNNQQSPNQSSGEYYSIPTTGDSQMNVKLPKIHSNVDSE